MNDWIPPAVQEEIDRVTRTVGVTPTVDRPAPNAWRLTCSNDRVTGTIQVVKIRPGTWDVEKGTLFVDGERRPIARTLDEFTHIFRDPDTPWEPAEDPRPVAPPPADPAHAPQVVRVNFEQIRDQFPDATVTLGAAGRHWKITVDTDRRVIGIGYRQRPKSTTICCLTAWIDGVDRSHEAVDIASALALFAGTPMPEAPHGIGPARREAAAARVNSVEVRRQAVIRT